MTCAQKIKYFVTYDICYDTGYDSYYINGVDSRIELHSKNPFIGCKSEEEIKIKIDLLGGKQ